MQASILESLEPEVAADIVEEMSPDEAADALSELTDETTAEILEEMETEPVSDVKELLEFDEDTAGGMMNTEAIVLPEQTTLAEAMKEKNEGLLGQSNGLGIRGFYGTVVENAANSFTSENGLFSSLRGFPRVSSVSLGERVGRFMATFLTMWAARPDLACIFGSISERACSGGASL